MVQLASVGFSEALQKLRHARSIVASRKTFSAPLSINAVAFEGHLMAILTKSAHMNQAGLAIHPTFDPIPGDVIAADKDLADGSVFEG